MLWGWVSQGQDTITQCHAAERWHLHLAAPCRPLLCLPVFCRGSRPIPWPWLCSQVLCPALLLLSLIPQLDPTLLLTPFLPGCIHFSAPKDISLLFASALFRFFPPGRLLFSSSLHRCIPSGVLCPRVSRGEQSTSLRDLNAPIVSKCYPAFSICKIGCPRTAEQQACSTLTLFHQNNFSSSEISLRESLQAQEGKCHVSNEKDGMNKRPSTPSRRKAAQSSRVQDQGSAVSPLPSLLFVIRAPVSAASPAADGNALRHQRPQTTSPL